MFLPHPSLIAIFSPWRCFGFFFFFFQNYILYFSILYCGQFVFPWSEFLISTKHLTQTSGLWGIKWRLTRSATFLLWTQNKIQIKAQGSRLLYLWSFLLKLHAATVLHYWLLGLRMPDHPSPQPCPHSQPPPPPPGLKSSGVLCPTALLHRGVSTPQTANVGLLCLHLDGQLLKTCNNDFSSFTAAFCLIDIRRSINISVTVGWIRI